MPEGPEIRRAADSLERAVAGHPLTRVWFAYEELKPFTEMLVGKSIERIETRGKAMLTHFSNGLTLYTHNQLYGVWRIVDAGETPQSSRVLRVRLETADKAILLYSASDIEIVEQSQLGQQPFLKRLGPDVLDDSLTIGSVKERILSASFRRRQLGSLMLDQAFLAGPGNYLRAEILWEAEIAPRHCAGDLDDDALDRLAQAILDVPRRSYLTRGESSNSKHHGTLFRFRVFHRAGEPCERCFNIIEKITLSSRPFYWCPHCQK
ncbi:endonuclease VIII [Citrobacter sp. JGM124]|uniref:endonuclease VIII n=1 Tax=Citrobacter sp. JGM124 TaxID=2799789 RepID=UPI001BAA9C87|nr:endonuclease VIII [Citrobacter sp. JGM124]MBS0848596.1 endonuclease VIII [Citrobacter sp. JGM124]